MRRKSLSFKESFLRPRNAKILKENEKLRYKQSKNSINQDKIDKEKEIIRENRKEMQSNAYKNIITVISNILDNIEEQKINGKSNLLYVQESSRNKKKPQINKKPAKKLDSYTSPEIKYNLNYTSTKNCNKNKTSTKKSIDKSIDKLNNKKPSLELINMRNKNKTCVKNFESFDTHSSINIESDIKKEKIKEKEKAYKSLLKWSSEKTIKSNFFKPKNRLKTKNISNKFLLSDYKSNINDCSGNNASSMADSSGISIKPPIPILPSNKSNIKLKERSSYQESKFRSSVTNKSEIKVDNNNKSDLFSPFNTIRQKVKMSTKSIQQTLYEYENNEITHEINHLPDDNILMKKKRNQRKRKNEFILEEKIKNIIDLKPLRNNYIKNMGQFYKENNYRKLLNKGHVYDSLDDDEESDEEDINIFYIEPNNKFLYILDSITFISSLIMLIYFPVSLSKQNFFCDYIKSKDTLLFHTIDFIYIFDLIINFYRSYYDYNDFLIKKNSKIFIHYLKTWLLLDLISAIPFYTIIKVTETKCLGNNIYYDYKLNNNGKHSYHYNININNLHYFFTFAKVIKTFKVFKHNISVKIMKKKFNYIDFFYDWGNVLFYTFLFFSFLNFGSCLFIFVGRNTEDNWIYLLGFKESNFNAIYFAAMQYLIETVTTVGYGELVGKSLYEIIFQIIMLIVGTCIYSWLISTISTYVKKINEKNIKYEEKVQILEEIKLNNPKFTDKLHDKILRLLNYRKFHEEETEKNILFDSLPNSLKNTLVIEMYRSYINGFLFFKNVENREFIVQVISKLKPVLGKKGDILLQEGENFEELIFIKSGFVSLEVWIDMTCPEESVENYLVENGYINTLKKKTLKKITFQSSLAYENTYNYFNTKNKTDNFFFKEELPIIEHNKKKLKVLDIRENEHFGDVFMFLNKKSPFYIRVGSKKADLLFLKKLDALNISYNFPNIWKSIIKKPLANVKIITKLTFKVLTSFCNFNGIKTKFFKKKKNNQYNPAYYLAPILNPLKANTFKKVDNNNEKFFLEQKTEGIKLKLRNYIKNSTIKNKENKDSEDNNNLQDEEEEDYINDTNELNNVRTESYRENSPFLIKKTNSKNNEENCKIVHNNSLFKNMKTKYDYINNKIDEEKEEYENFDEDEGFSPRKKKTKKDLSKKHSEKYKIVINKPEEIKLNKKISDNNITQKKDHKNDLNFNMEVNDEIYPGEIFELKLFDDEKPKKIIDNKNIILNNININNNKVEKVSESVYINNLNIIGKNYVGTSSEEQKILEEKIKLLEIELQKIKKKNFNKLEISSSVSTLEINSSYENLNEISNNTYIIDAGLRESTKQYIKNRNISRRSFINTSINSEKDFISSKGNNTKLFKFYNSSIGQLKNKDPFSTKIVSEKINTKKLNINNNNKNVKNLFKSIIQNPSNQTNKAEIFLNKIRNKNRSSVNFKQVRHASVDIYRSHYNSNSNFFDQKKKSNTIEEEEKKKKRYHENISNKNPNNIVKKKKKKNELDIISLNIQKGSQNLNQPDVFYAGLFSQLMFKGNSHANDNKDLKYKSTNNNENGDIISNNDKNSYENSSEKDY